MKPATQAAVLCLLCFAVLALLTLTGCAGLPMTASIGYVSETGRHYDASVGFTLPEKKGLAK